MTITANTTFSEQTSLSFASWKGYELIELEEIHFGRSDSPSKTRAAIASIFEGVIPFHSGTVGVTEDVHASL